MKKILLVLALLLSSSGAWAWLDADFAYRKEITVSNAGGALSDYQVRVLLNASNFDYGECDSGLDLRFGSASDVELPYFVQSWDESGTSIVWVKVDSIGAAGDTSIYVYYSSSNTSNVSDPDGVFLFYDDFRGAAINASKWSTVGTVNTWITANGSLRIQTNQIGGDYVNGIFTSSNFSRPFIVEFSMFVESTSATVIQGIHSTGENAAYANFPYGTHHSEDAGVPAFAIYEDGSSRGNQGHIPVAAWTVMRLLVKPTEGAEYLNESDFFNRSYGIRYNSTYGSESALDFGVTVGNPETYFQWDNVTVRAFSYVEPTLSIGTQETSSALSLNITGPANGSAVSASTFNITFDAANGSADGYQVDIYFAENDSESWDWGCSVAVLDEPISLYCPVSGLDWNKSYKFYGTINDSSSLVSTGNYSVFTPVLDCNQSNQSVLCAFTGVPSAQGFLYVKVCELSGGGCEYVAHIDSIGVLYDSVFGLEPGRSYNFSGFLPDQSTLINSFSFNIGECYSDADCSEGFYCSSNYCLFNESWLGYNSSWNDSTSNFTLNISDLGTVSPGDSLSIQAFYREDGVPAYILPADGECSFVSNGFIPSSGGMLLDTVGGSWYYPVTVLNSSGENRSYTVTCNFTGRSSGADWPILQKQDNFSILTSSQSSSILWVNRPVSVVQYSSALFKVRYRTSAGVGVSGASCRLLLGVSNLSMSDLGNGEYSYSFAASSVTTYQYYVHCSKSGYQSVQTGNYSLTVSAYSPTTTTLPEPDHCSNGYVDFDETDVDCGGSCGGCPEFYRCFSDEDCLSGWCYGDICHAVSCSDGVKNGDETGVDCGGSCDACLCFYNWDCSATGSESCVNYECSRDYCSVSSDCEPLLWYSSDLGYWSRERECFGGVCRFTSENVSLSNLSLVVLPKSYLVWNDSGRRVYVLTCEGGGNYFTVSTPVPSRKWYYHADPVYYSPFVPASENHDFGAREAVSGGYLPFLCSMNASQNHTFSLVTFQATEDGSAFSQSSIYVLAFKTAFQVDVELNGTDAIWINVSRPAYCFYKSDEADSWEAINVVAASSILWESDDDSSYYILCNNSYGESATDRFSGGSRMLLLFAWDLAALFGDRIFIAFTGSRFVWQDWYILPIFLLGLIIFPTLILIFIGVRSKKSGPDSGG